MSDTIFSAGNNALITGAGMGIGRAAAIHCARLGLGICLVDVLSDELDTTVSLCKEAGLAAGHSDIQIISNNTDITNEGIWTDLSAKITAEFGSLHLLMNNAVTRIGKGFDAPRSEWRTAFETNFWSVVAATDELLPLLKQTPGKSAIVNVGSKQGITNPPGHPIYNIAKSALKTYTEQLEHAIRNEGDSQVSTHLLVPGWTTTGHAEHKPGAWLPEQVVERMVSAVDNNDFYVICPDNEVSEAMDRKRIIWGAADITENRPPLSRWHDAYSDRASAECS